MKLFYFFKHPSPIEKKIKAEGGVIDLYGIESRPNYLMVKSRKLATSAESRQIFEIRDKMKKIRFVKYEEGIAIPQWGNRIAYGFIYTV